MELQMNFPLHHPKPSWRDELGLLEGVYGAKNKGQEFGIFYRS